jgi:RNA polymerase sigma-70 factor (ECF subfamily)|tara:strand:- start:554 stop:1099 length:546 start_codon:yes stop_codon:yes gene_type:complete
MIEKESALLQKVKTSDKKAFKQLFYSFYDTLFRFVLYKIQDRDIAEDITQETFLRVWKIRSNLEPKKSFFSLIARISSNLCYDHFRHIEVRQRHESIIPVNNESHYDNPESEVLADSLEKQIQAIVNNKLPEKCREVFILSRVEGLSNIEIAESLDISIRTVENQVYRAIKILKKNLKNYL